MNECFECYTCDITWWNITVELTTLGVSFVFIIEQGVLSYLSLYVILFVSTEAASQRCS